MPEFVYKSHRVSMGAGGEIVVAPGDTISGYCAAIYQAGPASTQAHWHEFGRKQKDGKVVALADPNKISAGETLYHMPSIGKTIVEKTVDGDKLAMKLHALKRLREDGLKVYDGVHRDLVKQKKDVDNFSLALDMAGVVVSAVVTGWVQVGKAFKAGANVIDDVTKAIVERSWGVGVQPQNQGLVQGISQNVIAYGDNLALKEDDHTVKAIGKILVQSFIDYTSPSYWSKKMAGGDPKDQLDQVIEMNKANRENFLNTIDRSIEQTAALLNQFRSHCQK